MRVLFLSTPVPTHLAPQIPLAWALRGAGHDVLVVGQPDLVDLAHSAGLSVQVVGEEFCVNELLGTPPGVRPAHAGRPPADAMAGGSRVWINHARYVTGPYLETARAWRPDLIVSDRLEFASLVVGAALGVPVVAHRWGIDVIATGAFPMATRALDGLARRFGVAGLPAPDLVLDPAPPALQSPTAAPATPIRYVPFNGTGTLPAWGPRTSDAYRVCVSLGSRTIELNGLPMVRALADAASGLPDTELVMTVPARFRDELGAVPANVALVDPAPLHLVLDDFDAVVHHGGCGTLLTAARHGCAHLVLPQLLDMWEVGDLVQAAGAGRTVADATDQESPDVLGDALAGLASGVYRAGAARLAEDIAAAPSPAAVVGKLETALATSFADAFAETGAAAEPAASRPFRSGRVRVA